MMPPNCRITWLKAKAPVKCSASTIFGTDAVLDGPDSPATKAANAAMT